MIYCVLAHTPFKYTYNKLYFWVTYILTNAIEESYAVYSEEQGLMRPIFSV